MAVVHLAWTVPVDLTAWDVAAIVLVVAGVLVVLRRGVPKAYALGVLMMGVFAIEFAADTWGPGGVADHLAFQTQDVLHGARWWSPLTMVFVHAGWEHILGNLLIFLTAGPALEDRIGERKFLVIFFLAALAAEAAQVVLSFALPRVVPPDSLALGASGAIFGVLTAFAVRYPREQLPLFFFFVIWVPAFLVLLLYLGLNVVYMFTDTSIAWWGHFGGFLVGLAFAYTLPARPGATLSLRARARGLPDASKLEALARTPETRSILERIRQFTPEARTADDAHYADAWLDRFFAKATCPQGHAFRREGLRATCAGGETTVEFGR
jgi:membrane associated rhomboid family serine protease